METSLGIMTLTDLNLVIMKATMMEIRRHLGLMMVIMMDLMMVINLEKVRHLDSNLEIMMEKGSDFHLEINWLKVQILKLYSSN